jgi:hypothetical protein
MFTTQTYPDVLQESNARSYPFLITDGSFFANIKQNVAQEGSDETCGTKCLSKRAACSKKVLISFCCLILFPLGLFGYVSLTITNQTIQEQVVAAKLKSLGLISDMGT